MRSEQREKKILLLSFVSGLLFAVIEFIFAIYSHSQSALTDAVYDASELVFIALLLFLTPLFHKPVSEKHPYGYFQVESIFVIIKGVMMLSVTVGISADVIESALAGGNPVNRVQVSVFQLCLGILSIVIYLVIRHLTAGTTSPTAAAELLGWKLDILYSLGMSLAFFGSLFLQNTPLSALAPYFDQIIAVLVMGFTLPESVKVLWEAIKDIFLFSPNEDMVADIKALCGEVLQQYKFTPVFFDITRTGRHLWVAVYFQIESESLAVSALEQALRSVSEKIDTKFQDCTCELILIP